MADVADFFVDYISSDVSCISTMLQFLFNRPLTGAWNHRHQLDDYFRPK